MINYITKDEKYIKRRKETRNTALEIKGELKELIYQNDVNGYTIGVLDTDDEEITVVGYLPFISIGDNLKLIGKYVTHKIMVGNLK